MTWTTNKVPVSYAVAGMKYKVVRTTFASSMQCIKGTFHPGQKLVTLARNMKVGSLTVRLTPAQVYKTFWHEAVHSILYENGYTSANDDEKLVDVLAVGIVEVIKSGKYED